MAAVRVFATCALLFTAGAHAARMPFNTANVGSAVSELAKIAADGVLGQRHLQAAASSGNSMGMMAALSPQLQGLAGTSAASNAAGNTGASAAAAVTNAVNSLGASTGASISSESDVQLALEKLLLQFCSNEKFTAPKNVSASWIGSGATIALVPHTCLIYPDTNTLKCSPAKLVLYRTEGSYNKAYVSAAKWKGKECKIQEQLGQGSQEVFGGAKYTVDVPAAPVFKSLWTPVYANQDIVTDSSAEEPAADMPAPASGASAAASAASGKKKMTKDNHKVNSKWMPKKKLDKPKHVSMHKKADKQEHKWMPKPTKSHSDDHHNKEPSHKHESHHGWHKPTKGNSASASASVAA